MTRRRRRVTLPSLYYTRPRGPPLLMPCNVALTGAFKSISRGALNSNPPTARCSSLPHTHTHKNTFTDRDTKIHHNCFSPHMQVYGFLWSELACCFSFSCASTQLPEITALPAGSQAGRRCRGEPWMCSACYLMSVGMSPRACLPVPGSQASTHVESASSIKQLADSSALYFSLSVPYFKEDLEWKTTFAIDFLNNSFFPQVSPETSSRPHSYINF